MRFLIVFLLPFLGLSQVNWQKKKLPEFENIYSEKISEDSLQSTFFIAVKKSVPKHYHLNHSECIVVLSGKAIMTLNSTDISLSKGMQVSIPKGTIHSLVVSGRKPLKVISIQSPFFDGTDRFIPDN